MPPAIETHHLRRRFGDRWAVDGLDLTVQTGSVYGFLGPNGAGKTTTIRLMLGLLKPTSGTIRILGQPMPARRLAVARHIGALVETPTFYDHLTGEENLDITRRLTGAPPSSVARVLETVDLIAAARRRAGTYSLGMRQRLGIARALIAEPKIVLLDEPTNGLDPQGIRETRDLIRALPQRSGATVLVSSHLLYEIEQTATHVGLMSAGRMIAEGAVPQLLGNAEPQLELAVTNAPAALRLLHALGLAAMPGPDGRIVIALPAAAAHTPQSINRRLVEAGFDVTHLALRKPTLEELFMRLTGMPNEDAA